MLGEDIKSQFCLSEEDRHTIACQCEQLMRLAQLPDGCKGKEAVEFSKNIHKALSQKGIDFLLYYGLAFLVYEALEITREGKNG